MTTARSLRESMPGSPARAEIRMASLSADRTSGLSNEPNALREAKRLFAQETLPPDSEIDRGWEGHWASWNSEQGREGVRAFLEKR